MAGSASIGWIKMSVDPPAGPQDVTFLTLTNWQESPDNRWRCVAQADGGGRADIALAGDGYFQAMYITSDISFGAIISLSESNAIGEPYYSTADFSLGVGGAETYEARDPDGSIDTEVGALDGDLFRMRREGTTLVAEYYRGGSWTLLYTYPNSSSAPLFLSGWTVNISQPNWLVEPKQEGAS